MADRTINLKVQAQTAKAQADIKKLQAQLNQLSKTNLGAVATRNITKNMSNLGAQTKRTTTQMERLGSRINTVFNAGIVLIFTNAVAKAGDSVLNLSNQLKSSGVEAKNLNQNVAFTLRTANATRTSFQSAGVLLARMTRSTATLGFGMKDVQRATTTVIKGFQLAGATTQEATQSVIQLSQGLASGALRGDELRSVLEGAPVLAASIAKELGVGVGQLRDMGKEGKITSEVVMRALLNDADDLDAKFAQMKPTFEGAFEVLKNGLSVAVGETANILGDALGIKEAFQNVGKSLTEAFLDGRVRVAVGELVRDAREAAARIKGFFADTFADFGLDIPDLTDILAGLATLLGMRALRSGRSTAFTPIRNDVDAIDKRVDGLSNKLKKGFTVGKATGFTDIDTRLGQTSASATALRNNLAKPLPMGRLSGFTDIDTRLGETSTSATALRTGLAKDFKLGRFTGFNDLQEGIGRSKSSATSLRKHLGKDFAMGKLTGVEGITSPLTTIATQVRNLRTSLGKKFVLGETSTTEGSGTAPGGFLLAPSRSNEPTPLKAPNTAPFKEATKVVNGYANGIARFFGQISTSIGAMADKTNFKLGVLDEAIEKNTKGLDKATKRVNTHSGAINRLGLLYDGLADKDFGTDKERSLAARLDAESAKLNQAKADVERYNSSLKANDAARGSFITGLEAQQKAFTKTQRVFARMAGVMNVQLPTLRTSFDALAKTATRVGDAFTVMGDKATTARGKMNNAMNIVRGAQSGIAGQVGGTIGATVILSEFFTVEDDGTFANSIVEKIRSAISQAIQDYTPLDKDKADLGAKLATIISGAIGAFVAVSTIAGGISALLLAAISTPVVAAAAVITLSVALASNDDLAVAIRDLINHALHKALRGIGLNTDPSAIELTQDPATKAVDAVKDGRFDNVQLIRDRLTRAGRFEDLAKVEAALAEYQTEVEANVVAAQESASIWNGWNKGLINRLESKVASIEFLRGDITPSQQKQRNDYNSSFDTRGFASGGYISGPGTATSDSIPAMLSDGEFVMKASAVDKFGSGFMAKINAGILPQFFSDGGGVKANPEALQRLYDEQAKDTAAIAKFKVPTGTFDPRGNVDSGLSGSDAILFEALRLNIAERGADIASLEAQNARASASSSEKSGKGGPKTSPEQAAFKKVADETGVNAAESFKRTFASSFKEAFKTGDFSKIIPNLLDNFTGSIIDSVVDGFTENLFKGITGKDGSLSNFFSGMFSFGGEVQTKLGDSINKGVKGGEGGKGLSSMFSGLTETLSGLFSGLGDSLSGLLSGIGGGLSSAGGGLSSLLSVGMGFLGFSQGGIVPNTATSQIGKDSVPAMLMPGEVVLSKNDVSRMGNNSSQQQTVINLGITGNVDRETRRNIVKMMPQIAQGVNQQNKERGVRG